MRESSPKPAQAHLTSNPRVSPGCFPPTPLHLAATLLPFLFFVNRSFHLHLGPFCFTSGSLHLIPHPHPFPYLPLSSPHRTTNSLLCSSRAGSIPSRIGRLSLPTPRPRPLPAVVDRSSSSPSSPLSSSALTPPPLPLPRLSSLRHGCRPRLPLSALARACRPCSVVRSRALADPSAPPCPAGVVPRASRTPSPPRAHPCCRVRCCSCVPVSAFASVSVRWHCREVVLPRPLPPGAWSCISP